MKSIFYLIFLFIFGCASKPVNSNSPIAVVNTAVPKVCEEEVASTDYTPSSSKDYLSKLKTGDEIYFQRDNKLCEDTYFDDGSNSPVCGVDISAVLTWEKDRKIIDTVVFLESGCDQPRSP